MAKICGYCHDKIGWGTGTKCNRCRTHYHKSCLLQRASPRGVITCPNCGHQHKLR